MLANFFRNFVYPPHCIGCKETGTWMCRSCRNLLLVRAPPECVICRKISNRYETHEHCLRRTHIRQTVICWRYNTFAKKIMRSFKYRIQYGIVSSLIESAMEIVLPILPEESILTPVPTTPSHMRERGFNQSELLAREICKQADASGKEFHTAVEILLSKTAGSENQSGKSRKERLRARQDIEFSGDNINASSTPIFLIDDVCTTGTTLSHSAEALAQAGFKDVRAIALFRGKPRYSRERNKENQATPQDEQDPHEPPHADGGSKSSSESPFFPDS